MSKNKEVIKLKLIGLTCAHCAAKIESGVLGVKGVLEASLNFSTSQLQLTVLDKEAVEEVLALIKKIAPHVEAVISGDATNQTINKKELILKNWHLLGGIFLFLGGFLMGSPWLWVAAYLLSGFNVLKKALANLFTGQVFDENFLMMVATLGAIALGEYPEAIAVMLFYEIGELFQFLAVNRSRGSISALLDLRVASAHLVGPQTIETVPVESIKIGEEILVRAGERVPLDGVIIEGAANLDLSALTGESLPKFTQAGEGILSGAIVTNNPLKIRVTATSQDSTVAKILELVENAAGKKSKSERFITRFSRYYTPAVVAIALLVALVPTFFGASFSRWLYRALVFLVVSCPCALVVSIPLAWFAGIGAASKDGVLVKGANYLEMLQKVGTLVFDKTGTLTTGSFSVSEIVPSELTEAEFLRLAAHAEAHSNHPLAQSILKAYNGPIDYDSVSNVQEIPGRGVSALIDGKAVLVGNWEWVPGATAVFGGIHLSVDGIYGGYLVVCDRVKPTSAAAINRLRQDGIKNMVMLTGDCEGVARQVGERLGIKDIRFGLLPHEKVQAVEALLEELPQGSYLAVVGDGINDAPVLARADIGIAMGGLGSDAAIEAADLVLMKDDPLAIVAAMTRSKQVLKVLRQNIGIALGIKFLVMLLSLLGVADLWMAVFADVGVTVITIINSIRILK